MNYERWKRWIHGALVLLDAILINVSFALAYWIRYKLQWFRAIEPANYVPYSRYIPASLILTALLFVLFNLERLYSPQRGESFLEEFHKILNGTTNGIILLIALTFFYRPLAYSRLLFLEAAFLIVLILGLVRAAKHMLMARLRKKGVGIDKVLIVGAGEVGRALMRSIAARPELGYQVVGFVDDNPEKGNKDLGRFKAMGSLDNLPKILEEREVSEVFITLPWQYHRKIIKLISQCNRANVRARIVPDFYQMSLNKLDLQQINGIPLIGFKEISIHGWNLLLKRAIDVALSGMALVLLSPLMGLIAIAIKLDSPGPVFFKQKRVGRRGKVFTIYKFRSMVEGAEEMLPQLMEHNEVDGPIFKMKDDPRRTRVGRFLRRTSLDELPQLYNVLKGDMSLVGPRPPIPEEVEQYKEWQKKRLEVLPGITGLWQVSGRSRLSFDDMVLLDIYYAENWSLWLDFTILLRTIPKVILGEGAY